MPGQPSLFERFMLQVRVTRGCWVWKGVVDAYGYGRIREGTKKEKAHRLAWRYAVGPIPNGMVICHRCDVPGCVRPSHLFVGTNKANSEDMARKGRWANGERTGDSYAMTLPKVRELRRLRDAKGASFAELAKRYGITSGMAYRIARRLTWPDPLPAGRRKLTSKEAQEIRRLHYTQGLSHEAIGRRFKVSGMTISSIVRGARYNPSH